MPNPAIHFNALTVNLFLIVKISELLRRWILSSKSRLTDCGIFVAVGGRAVVDD
jgi:hypothetical protein